MLKTQTWTILVLLLLAGSAAASLLVAEKTTDGTMANVYLDGNCVRSIDLSAVREAYSFDVEGLCGTNRITVERGRICVEQADCPDQICVHQGWIADSAAPIVCLPNKLVIRVESAAGQAAEIDSVAQRGRDASEQRA